MENQKIVVFENSSIRIETVKKWSELPEHHRDENYTQQNWIDKMWNSDAKCIIVTAKALNQNDGQIHEKTAGWLSGTLSLHGFNKTPGYIYEKACEEIFANQNEIRNSLLKLGRKLEEENKAGKGVTHKISHPLEESEINAVRKLHQKNAPDGTFH
jgi:hypothetical protein